MSENDLNLLDNNQNQTVKYFNLINKPSSQMIINSYQNENPAPVPTRSVVQSTTNNLNNCNKSSSIMNNQQQNEFCCVLCALGETNLLSQGKLNRFKSTNHFNTNNLINLKLFLLNTNDPNSTKQININYKSSKLKASMLLKIGVKSISQLLLNEISKIGWTMDINLKASDMFDLQTDSFYVHFNCFIWSYGIQCDTNDQPLNIDKIVFESLTKKCFLCDLYGASLKCSVQDCPHIYHFPCAVLSGCYQNLATHQILCPNHAHQSSIYFNNKCLLCDSSDRITEQLYCTSCGFYYHSNCLSPPIEPNPLIRIGWQCPECKICQNCQKPEDDSKMLVCDTCDKCYHSYCLKNEIFLMKNSNGWKCDTCKRELSLTRACLSCKGLVFKDSIECLCEACQEIKRNLNQENNKKRSVKDLLQLSRNQMNSPSPIKKEFNETNVNINIKSEPPTDIVAKPINTVSNKPSIVTKKKQIPKKNNRNMKRSGQGAMNQMSITTRGTRSRNSGKDPKTDQTKRYEEESDSQKKKTSQNDESSTIGTVKRDEDDHHAVTVISSLNDSFSLRQDMCLSCGSLGKGESGKILSCSQCGQCFHTFCAGVNNVCDIMLEKGWRCLDCTVCEGCGKATDEGRLLLCDDCDISYHIYCLDPPLDQVPQGNWKCKWCVKCIKCGSKTPGKNLEWKSNYTECAYCNSLCTCHLCNLNYTESDLIGKCIKCERWSHLNCKNNQNLTEEEAEKKYGQNFKCLKCNEPENKTDNLSKKKNAKNVNMNEAIQNESLIFMEEIANLSKRCQIDEGIYLTDLGADLIKKLKIKPLPCPRRRVLKSNNINPETDINKIIDENSQSSNDDKAESIHDENNVDIEPNLMDPCKKQVPSASTINAPKRQINFGMGGFYVKTRRIKPQLSQIDQETNENENKIQKRKKKYTYEDMIPSYMQEAFFGSATLSNCQDANLNFDEPLEKFEKQNLDAHKINLDENMLKLAQQNKKEHLELGIEDFLDGDIVSYLFNENRNLMEFNSDQDLNNKTRTSEDKIFDEKIYEDLLHQIVTDTNQKSNPVDEYLNLNHHNTENSESVNDNRNIDDLARQFRESTHKYASNQAHNSMSNIDIYNNQTEFLNIQEPLMKVSNFIPEQVMRPPQIEPNKIVQNQFTPTNLVFNNNNNNNQNIKFTNYVNDQQINQNFQPPENRSFNLPPQPQPQQIQTQQQTIMPSPKPTETPLESQISFEEQESSNDCFNNSGPKSSQNKDSKEDLSKHQKILEKYAEDEELGEFATQAMPLYSNINFPNLKNEMKDVQERYRYVHKIWRKLDTQVKLNYINKSRNNRYKKKSDEKTTTKTKSRAKSPLNSDVENFHSRSATPSISMDDTNENSQMSHQQQIQINQINHINQINQIAPGQILVCQLPAQGQQTIQVQQAQIKEMDQILHHHLQQQQLQQQQQQMSAKQEKITIKSYLNNQMNAVLSSSSVPSTSNSSHSITSNQNLPTQFNFSIPNTSVNHQIVIQENKEQHIEKNSNKDTVSDHIDSIIEQVVAGSGSLSGDFDWDDEETSSSFREFLLSQMENSPSNSNDKPTKPKKKSTKANQEDGTSTTKTKKKKSQKNESQQQQQQQQQAQPQIQNQVHTQINTNQSQLQNQLQQVQQIHQPPPNQQTLDQAKINISIPQNINLNHRTIITNSATKINEILMMNQQHQNYQQMNSNNNVFFIPATSQFTLQDSQNNKIICKDDSFKKILSIPGNELLVEAPNIQNQNFNLQKNLLVKNILVTQSEHEQNPQQQQGNGLQFLQLDGQIDEFEQQKNSNENSQQIAFQKQESHFNPKLSTKVVINHELLNSYGITYNPSAQSSTFTQPTVSNPEYSIANPTFISKGDNTLLKQLLNTAPKNAVPEVKQEIKVENLPVTQAPLPVPVPEKVKKTKSDKPRVQKPKSQSKLLTDLKNKIESNISQENSDEPNSRKRKNIKKEEVNTEVMINKILDEIKTYGSLSMFQPKLDKNDEIYKNINLPERDHFLKFRSFNLKHYGDLFNLRVNLEIKKSDDDDDELFFNSKNQQILYNKKIVQQSFKVCSVEMDKPLDLKINRELITDSKERLHCVLESGIESERILDEDSNMTDYNGQILFSKPSSPKIDFENLHHVSVKKEANESSDDKIKTTFKLSQSASANFKETIEKLSEILNINTPGVLDLGKMVKYEPKIVDNSNKICPIVTETLHTAQTLNNLKFNLCKFCECFIDEDKENLDNNNKILFCSEYCKTSFQKLLNLKYLKSTQNSTNLPLEIKNEKRLMKWTRNCSTVPLNTESKVQTDKFELLKPNGYTDKRICIFCKLTGDLESNGPCRLLSIDVDQWSHLNCALWSDEVYETMNGALINVDTAYKKSINLQCCYCHEKGASLRCFSPKCNCYYHLPCAIRDKCAFNQDKTIYCSTHSCKALNENRLTDLTVTRNVWIQRDEVAQIQSFMSRDFDENAYAIRIGSLILHNIGQLLPHQLNSGYFNNRDFIYPIGYRATRIYWSTKNGFKRCRYLCTINETDGLPEFSVTLIEENGEKEILIDKSPSDLWKKILGKIEILRRDLDLVKLFPIYFSGEYMFGLCEPHIIRLVESLPGVEMLVNYAFKFGRLQLLDMPLTINPTGCARSEPKLRTHFRKSRTLTCTAPSVNPAQRSDSNGSANGSSGPSLSQVYENIYNDGDDGSSDEEDFVNKVTNDSDNNGLVSYTKQFVLSKSTQFKKLKAEWRQNVYLAKSKIQGLGLYAARDLEKNTMIIEYIGELIRNEVANRREKLYESQNRGIYMFRLNDELVVDATISGGLARYVNHCCDPNCFAETVSVEKDQKIIIIANKKILKGEELTYDYQFEFEDENNKIQCLCGSANCKKWMN